MQASLFSFFKKDDASKNPSTPKPAATIKKPATPSSGNKPGVVKSSPVVSKPAVSASPVVSKTPATPITPSVSAAKKNKKEEEDTIAAAAPIVVEEVVEKMQVDEEEKVAKEAAEKSVQKKRRVLESDDEEEEKEAEEAPPKMPKQKSSPTTLPRRRVVLASQSDDEEEAAPKKKTPEKKGKKETKNNKKKKDSDDDDGDSDFAFDGEESSEESEFDDDEDDEDFSGEDEDDDDYKKKSKKRKQTPSKKATTPPQKKKATPAAKDDEDEKMADAVATPAVSNNKSRTLADFGLKSKTTTPAAKSPSVASSSASSSLFMTQDEKKRAKNAKFTEKNHDRYQWLEDVRDANKKKPDEEGYNPRTLYVPPSFYQKCSNFERQFWEIKSAHWDIILFFKKGKFYELYEKDADVGLRELGLKMTDRVNMRMVGVPEKSFRKFASQLISLGYRVGRVEQMETLNAANKRRKSSGTPAKDNVCERALCGILTRGTLVEEDMLNGPDASYLLSVTEDPLKREIGVCLIDASTASFYLHSFIDDEQHTELETILLRYRPKEVIYPREEISEVGLKLVKQHVDQDGIVALQPISEYWDDLTTLSELDSYFSNDSDETTSSKDRSNWPSLLQTLASSSSSSSSSSLSIRCISSLGGAVSYLRQLMIDDDLVSSGMFSRLDSLEMRGGRMVLDAQTLSNLSILENDVGGKEGTLFKLLDRCYTAFGKRLLRHWICSPLCDVSELNARYDAVAALSENADLRGSLGAKLRNLPDLERAVARFSPSKKSGVKKQGVMFDDSTNRKFCEFAAMLDGMEALERIWRTVPDDLSLCGIKLPDVKTPLDKLSKAFDRRAAREGGVVKVSPGVVQEYDDALKTVEDIKESLDQYLEEQKSELKLRALSYWSAANGKEPYQLSIPAEWMSRNKLPTGWDVLSQTKQVVRCYSPYLRKTVHELILAQEDLEEATKILTTRLMQMFCEDYSTWRGAVQATAQLDVLISLSYTADAIDPVCRPEVADDGSVSGIHAEELRHPFLCLYSPSPFVPNDIALGEDRAERCLLVTGPNMGGKSTLLRQVCVAVIMAQVGAFVPARQFRLKPIDRIFTRIGAHDRMLAGQSTFMVELRETAAILRQATPSSLVILDELGRGTATFDGYAIAFAVLKELVEMKSLCLFSTHYHMLTDEMSEEDGVGLRHMTCMVDEVEKRVTFLYKFASGIAPRSYGVHCASLAGLPKSVVNRASQCAAEFEASTAIITNPHLKILASELFLAAGGKEADLSLLHSRATKALSFAQV